MINVTRSVHHTVTDTWTKDGTFTIVMRDRRLPTFTLYECFAFLSFDFLEQTVLVTFIPYEASMCLRG